MKKYCVLSAAGNDNTNGNPDNIIFTITDTKLYVPVVTLSARDNQKLSKFLSKEFEKIKQMNLDIFSNQFLLDSINHLL